MGQTTRDPAKWEKSIKATVLALYHNLRAAPYKTPLAEALSSWTETYIEGNFVFSVVPTVILISGSVPPEKYHGGRLETHAQQELLDHTDRVKRNIPADKLLVYEVGEGWDRLVEFLGVYVPFSSSALLGSVQGTAPGAPLSLFADLHA
jgi:hypothetical protein